MDDGKRSADYKHLYRTTRWRVVRKRILKRDKWQCVACLEAGVVTPATDVDHIIPAIVDMEVFWEERNMQSLCRACHLDKTAEENVKRSEDKRRVRFDISTGRPLSGRNA